jgi:DNA-binding transcriptional MerR regulator
MRKASTLLTIGKAAATAGVTPDTLRHYEREGLLPHPKTTEAGYRLYDAAAIERLAFVQQAKACGFSLDEIAGLLALRDQSTGCCNDVRRVAAERKLRLEAQIKSLTTMSSSLDSLLALCDDGRLGVASCPILAGIANNGAAKS